MGLRALCLAGFVLAICPAASLAAGRPPLTRLSDAYDGNISSIGAAFQSDGARFVTFSDAAGQVVALDAADGARSPVSLSPCGSSPPPAPGVSLVGVGGPDVFYPAGLSQGQLITFCFDGTYSTTPEEFRLINLAARTSRLVTFDPPANDGPLNDLTGPGTDGSDWADVLGGTPGELDRGFFNLTTGGVVEPAPTLPDDEYFDLDSTQLTHRLCAPVTTANVEDPASRLPIAVNVVGVDRPWAVLEADADSSPGGGPASAELYAWECGARKPVRLGPVDPQHEQFGDGIVTWVDDHGTANAEDLATRRHWTWPPARSTPGGAKVGYAEALHTASRIYVVPQVTAATSSGPQEIYTATLAGLRPRQDS
jgi:hypothetical protein